VDPNILHIDDNERRVLQGYRPAIGAPALRCGHESLQPVLAQSFAAHQSITVSMASGEARMIILIQLGLPWFGALAVISTNRLL
jgi:hypothetical protein